MALIVQTRDIDPAHPLLQDPNTRLWIYNGMDCCVTGHVHVKLAPLVDTPGHAIPYRFVRAMQGPALDMMRRGICVQPIDKRNAVDFYRRKQEKYQQLLDILADAVWGRGLNPNSNKQLVAFFYTALGLPVQYAIRKTPEGKVRTPTCDHGALEKLAKMEVLGPGIDPTDPKQLHIQPVCLAAPFVSLITSLRDCDKKLAVLASMRERFYTAYGVAGPVTARWSSFANAFGEGSNVQNVTPEMRRACCADTGKKLGNVDFEQAESRWVAALAWSVTGKDRYWKACESGDLHTVVCTMSWKAEFKHHGDWMDGQGVYVGDLKAARAQAETKWYRHLTFRDGAKRIGHGTNYWGTAYGIAMQIGSVEASIVAGFQHTYLNTFTEIRDWHNDTISTVQRTQQLTTPLGRTRTFFGRVTDDSTLREAIAHVPQSCNAELLNVALYRLWRFGIDGGPDGSPGTITVEGRTHRWRSVCELLLQVHDSVTFQYPDDPAIEAAVFAKVLELMHVPVPITQRTTGEVRHLTIPLSPECGWNWGKLDKKKATFDDGNPDGLTGYDGPGADARKRTTPAKPALADWL